MTMTYTTRNALRYASLLGYVLTVQAGFLALCLVSRECREIRRECIKADDVIDPIREPLGELFDLHVSLFGR